MLKTTQPKTDKMIRYKRHIIKGNNKYNNGNTARIVQVEDTGTEGTFTWLINGEHYRVGVGDYILFNPSDIRSPLVKHSPSDVKIRYLSFKVDALFPGTELLDLFYGEYRIHHIPAEKAASLASSFERVAEECEKTDRYSQNAASAALRLLVIDILRVVASDYENAVYSVSKTMVSHTELMNELVVYLYDHMSEHLTVGETAARFNISESLLSKLFRSMIGMSFPEYIRRLRINMVIDLINRNNMGVLDAAYESGFKSVSGFYKSFSEIMGMSPSEYFSKNKNAEKWNNSQ